MLFNLISFQEWAMPDHLQLQKKTTSSLETKFCISKDHLQQYNNDRITKIKP